MGDMYVNGHMSISSFKVYRKTSSGWVKADALMYNQKYRFRFRVVNRASGYPTIRFDRVWVRILSDGRTRYYRSSSYTGSYKTYFVSNKYDNKVLSPGYGKYIYAYFVWRGSDGYQVAGYAPVVGMNARQLQYLPTGPTVPLFPNRQ